MRLTEFLPLLPNLWVNTAVLSLEHLPNTLAASIWEMCIRDRPYAGAYYYVPTLFVNHDKSYEAHPGDTYEVICEAVEKALAAAK